MMLLPIFIFLTGLILAQGASCPNGFISYGSSCYHYSHDTETWYDALGVCKTIYNGYLVEINNAQENAFLIQQATSFKTEYWIGANDLQVEGEWKWATSGTDVTTATFGNPPSNSHNDENCAEINTGVWNDDSCHVAQHYICEVDDKEVEVVG